MLGMADEHISYGAVINPEVGPMAWKTRKGGVGLCGCARWARSRFGIRGSEGSVSLTGRRLKFGDLKLTSNVGFVALRG
jgi:hypothetical protein